MFNLTCENAFFPQTDSENVTSISDNPGSIAVQSSASVVVLVLYLALLSLRRTPRVLRPALFAFAAASVAKGFLTYRLFELLACDLIFSPEQSISWAITTLISQSIVDVALLLLLFPIRKQLTVFLYILLAGGMAAVNWILRGGIVLSRAALPVIAIQQFYCTQAGLLLFLPQLRTRFFRRKQIAPTVHDPTRKKTESETDSVWKWTFKYPGIH